MLRELFIAVPKGVEARECDEGEHLVKVVASNNPEELLALPRGDGDVHVAFGSRVNVYASSEGGSRCFFFEAPLFTSSTSARRTDNRVTLFTRTDIAICEESGERFATYEQALERHGRTRASVKPWSDEGMALARGACEARRAMGEQVARDRSRAPLSAFLDALNAFGAALFD